MIKKFLKLIALLSMLATAFVVYSAYTMASDVLGGKDSQLQRQLQNPETQQNVIKYGRKAMSTALAIAEPVLSKFGVDLKGKYTEDSDEITRHLQEASSALDAATKKITGTR